MILARTWRCQVDGLIAVPRFVVIALTLLSVRVTNVVSVLLFELLVVNVIFPGELSLPESKRLIQSQADSF